MQINPGTFGGVVAPAAQAVEAPRLDVSSGANALTSTMAGINNDAAKRQLELDDKARAAQTALDVAKTTNQMHDAHDEVAQGVASGDIPADQAQAQLSERIGKITGSATDGYSPDRQALMRAQFDQVGGALQRNMGEVVFKRKQSDTAATIDQFGEQVSRQAAQLGPQWASDKFDTMVDFTGGAAGLNEAQQAKLKQSFKERTFSSYFDGLAVNALTNMDEAGLAALRQRIAGPEGDALDPQKRATLTHQIFGYERHVLAMKQRDANAAEQEARIRYNQAADLYNQGADIAMAGGYLSPDFIRQMTDAAQGTEMEKPVLNLIASQQVVAGFATSPADQRMAAIERMRAQRASPDQGTDPIHEKLLSAMVTMNDKLNAQAKDNPWQAAQSAGVIKDSPVMNPADPQSAAQVMAARMQQIGKVESWAGHKVSPLQPQEVETVAKMVRSLPIDQAASLLASMGQTVGDADRVAALSKQLYDKDGSLGLAMMYANAKTTEGRYTAELVLRGEQALHDKTAMIDNAAETGWKGTIAKSIRGAYSNREAEDAYIDAAYKIAAAQYAKNGSVDIDSAIKLATGGIVERNGQKVPLPYGMKESDFDKRINAVSAADIAPQAPGGQVYAGRTPMSVADFVAKLPQATLVHAGQGVYNVRAGAATVTNKDGTRITIKVQP